MNKRTAYWWKSIPNFGDRMSPLLLSRFAKIQATWSDSDTAQILSVGSILDRVSTNWEGTIMGSGKLFPASTLRFPRAKILGLRGPLSAKGVKGTFAIGDPGLLANELVTVETKKHNLGILPHWSDTTLIHNPIFKNFNPVFINPRDPPLEVIRQIGECRKLVTSSLHGVIVADAFNIPRRIEYSSTMDKEGGLFKFEDYHASVHLKLELGKLSSPSRFWVETRKHEIFDAFYELGKL